MQSQLKTKLDEGFASTQQKSFKQLFALCKHSTPNHWCCFKPHGSLGYVDLALDYSPGSP